MLYALLVTFREGLEAALILGIVLSALRRTAPGVAAGPIWVGAGLAGALSLVAAILLELLAVELAGRWQEALEGAAMLLAVAVLTWMLAWMRRQSATLGTDLRHRLHAALERRSSAALGLLAFAAVGREGLETALFLFGGSSRSESVLLYWGGAAAGLALATVAGVLLYRGALAIPLRPFFTVSSLALNILAAGMVPNALKELAEAGLMVDLGPRLWDTYSLLPDNQGTGRLLATILGYDASPFAGQVVAYLAYLLAALAIFIAAGRPTNPAGAPA